MRVESMDGRPPNALDSRETEFVENASEAITIPAMSAAEILG
jgi:hypothetical protein